MCGLAGLLNFRSSFTPELIQAMTQTLSHRGPDDEGYLAVDINAEDLRVISLGGPDSQISGVPLIGQTSGRHHLYLGHRRLAILDLSTAGHQPMRRGHLWIVFNGEIYNYVELKEELKADGYQFESSSDTEVILAAYERWGEKCVARFNGDWAFCILDTRRRLLFLSRDRYGVKPLYFFRDRERFAFASEIKAILSLPVVTPSLNRETAFDYYVLSCRDHTEETLFAGIHQLMPGQNLTVDIRSGEITKQFYYRIERNVEFGEYRHKTALKYASDVRELLTDSVRLRLRADVPVGTCLSGGIDSSAVAAIMANLLGGEVKAQLQNTFTASFPGQAADETQFARVVAKAIGARNHFVYPSREGYWAALPKILYHQDEPFGGASIYSSWEVMRRAAEHVKVLLDGHGGDEVFAGYKEYRLSFLTSLLARGKVSKFITELWSTVKLAGGLRNAVPEIRALPFFVLDRSLKRAIYRLRYHQEFRDATKVFKLSGSWDLEHIDKRFSGDLNELLHNYMATYILPRLLHGEDRNSMAHSIETRVPFIDHRLVDFVFSLPAVYKIRHGWTKWLLRLAINDLLPAEIVWRRDKKGFATPRWASRQDEWNVWFQHNFQSDAADQGLRENNRYLRTKTA